MSLADELKNKLSEYRTAADREVQGSKSQRNLAIHNTTRQAYEKQIELIDELLDALDEGEEIVE